MISLIHGILKKWYKRTYIEKGNEPTDVENELMVTKGERRRRRHKLGVGN